VDSSRSWIVVGRFRRARRRCFPESPADTIHQAVVALDDDDLIRIADDQIDIAYPFSVSPTPLRSDCRTVRTAMPVVRWMPWHRADGRATSGDTVALPSLRDASEFSASWAV